MRATLTTTLGTLLAVVVSTAPAHPQGAPLGTAIPERPIGEEVGDERGPHAFLENQLTFPRVAAARDAREDSLRALFVHHDVDYESPELYMRVLKHERVLELWARDDGDEPFTLVKEYPVCALPGQLGPKQRMGDFQVPEGFYFIDAFNPRSSYHLSLRVNYPNMSDRIRREAIALGGDIYIHGGCQTAGCVPIENRNIEEVYWIAARAMDAGQQIIPIHIFPARMDDDSMRWLRQTFRPDAELLAFWQNLAEGYTYFQETRRVPWITVSRDGRYHVPAYERLAEDDAATPTAAPDTVVTDSIATDSIAADSVGSESPAGNENATSGGV